MLLVGSGAGIWTAGVQETSIDLIPELQAACEFNFIADPHSLGQACEAGLIFVGASERTWRFWSVTTNSPLTTPPTTANPQPPTTGTHSARASAAA